MTRYDNTAHAYDNAIIDEDYSDYYSASTFNQNLNIDNKPNRITTEIITIKGKDIFTEEKNSFDNDTSFISSIFGVVKFLKSRDRLVSISQLTNNWDSYNGKQPLSESIDAAFLSLACMEETIRSLGTYRNLHEPSFSPAPDGIVGFEWNIDGRQLFVRLHNKDYIDYYYSNPILKEERFAEGTIEDLGNLISWLITGDIWRLL